MEGDQILGGNVAADIPHNNAWYKNCLTFSIIFLINNYKLTTLQAQFFCVYYTDSYPSKKSKT
jgi:hypothetical protein